ncbi:hypothetical protein EUTSA_v10017456mg [Eutrema salsugineum]|uniref:Uncharacterized protein n=1 Tax=Eutrema salsugineum TaxID=72664 RepID=V4LMP1_EUTSA|nr:hypothetical protein EUTSA_v10017456mg [Eutrema salsugineum]
MNLEVLCSCFIITIIIFFITFTSDLYICKRSFDETADKLGREREKYLWHLRRLITSSSLSWIKLKERRKTGAKHHLNTNMLEMIDQYAYGRKYINMELIIISITLSFDRKT